MLRLLLEAEGYTVLEAPNGLEAVRIATAMHPDLVVVIDPAGNIVQETNSDPGPATGATQTSYAAMFAADARQAMSQS